MEFGRNQRRQDFHRAKERIIIVQVGTDRRPLTPCVVENVNHLGTEKGHPTIERHIQLPNQGPYLSPCIFGQVKDTDDAELRGIFIEHHGTNCSKISVGKMATLPSMETCFDPKLKSEITWDHSVSFLSYIRTKGPPIATATNDAIAVGRHGNCQTKVVICSFAN